MPSPANHQSLTSNATTPAQSCRNASLWLFSFLAFQNPSRWSGLLNSDPHGQWQCLSLLTPHYFFPSICLKHAYYVQYSVSDMSAKTLSNNDCNCISQIFRDVASPTERAPYLNSRIVRTTFCAKTSLFRNIVAVCRTYH